MEGTVALENIYSLTCGSPVFHSKRQPQEEMLPSKMVGVWAYAPILSVRSLDETCCDRLMQTSAQGCCKACVETTADPDYWRLRSPTHCIEVFCMHRLVRPSCPLHLEVTIDCPLLPLRTTGRALIIMKRSNPQSAGAPCLLLDYVSVMLGWYGKYPKLCFVPFSTGLFTPVTRTRRSTADLERMEWC